MSEILWEVLGAVFELLGEAVLALLAEFASRVLWRMLRKGGEALEKLSVATYLFLAVASGVLCGWLSVQIAPTRIIHMAHVHGLSLLLAPLLVGTAMAWLRTTGGHRASGAELRRSMAFGAVFAFCMALMRLVFVSN